MIDESHHNKNSINIITQNYFPTTVMSLFRSTGFLPLVWKENENSFDSKKIKMEWNWDLFYKSIYT